MGRKDLASQQQKLLKSERWRPYIRYKKETDTWIMDAIQEDGVRDGGMEEIMDKVSQKLTILMNREELDIIARIVAYMYHDKKDEYEEIASDLRKEHIYKDLRAIDLWLNIQYKQLEKENEQSKQKKRQLL